MKRERPARGQLSAKPRSLVGRDGDLEELENALVAPVQRSGAVTSWSAGRRGAGQIAALGRAAHPARVRGVTDPFRGQARFLL